MNRPIVRSLIAISAGVALQLSARPPAGTLDLSFNVETDPPPTYFVKSISPRADGRVTFGGRFIVVEGYDSSQLGQVQATGLRDPGFAPGVGGQTVHSVLNLPNGNILVAGEYNAIAGAERLNLSILTHDGFVTPFNSHNATLGGEVYVARPLPNGQFLVGGSFPGHLLRLHADGSVDTNLTVQVNGAVHAITLAHRGRVLLGGSFTEVNGQSARGLVRLNRHHQVDPKFRSPFLFGDEASEGQPTVVHDLTITSAGHLIVAGQLMDNGATPLGQAFVMLNSRGKVLRTYDTGAGAHASGEKRGNSLARQRNGKILVGGLFELLATGQQDLVRLKANGRLDKKFRAPVFNGEVRAVSVQPDGRILVGGSFDMVDGHLRTLIARLFGDPVRRH